MPGPGPAGPHRYVVTGAGVLGVCLAARLAGEGAEVTLLEQDQPGHAATRSSFAWLNSNDKAPRAYHDLNVAGMRAWERLAASLGGAAWHRPVGNLEWAAGPSEHTELAARVRRLAGWGYPARLVSAAEAAALEPLLRLPPAVTEVAWFPEEGYLLTGAMVSHLLDQAAAQGVMVLTGEPGRVTGFEVPETGRGWGVRTAAGRLIPADVVVCCAGIQVPCLAALAGAASAARRRPGRSRWSPGRSPARRPRGWSSRRARSRRPARYGSCTRHRCTCGPTPAGWCTWKRRTRPWTCTRPTRSCAAGPASCWTARGG